MREILFRAKNNQGEWIYGWYAEIEGYYAIIDDVQNYHMIDIETLGQFTGLTDMNGTKIFEGDIVKDNDITLVIKWDNNNSRYEAIRPFKSLPKNYELTLSFCEVIGNIYDNKELLNN